MKVKLILGTVVSLSLGFGITYSISKWRSTDQSIKQIIQSGPEKEALKTAFLAELLHLSVDQPTDLRDLNLEEGKKLLEACPLIKKAELKRLMPHTLYIDYTSRQPIAYLADYKNTALDEEGYLFPNFPFYAPKRIPKIYFGLIASKMPVKLQGKQSSIAFDLLSILSMIKQERSLHVKWIDVSNVMATTYGKRQIVVILEEEKHLPNKQTVFSFSHILRLSSLKYSKELGNYLNLKKELDMQEQQQMMMEMREGSFLKMPQKVIDLRISDLAFISEVEEKIDELDTNRMD